MNFMIKHHRNGIQRVKNMRAKRRQGARLTDDMDMKYTKMTPERAHAIREMLMVNPPLAPVKQEFTPYEPKSETGQGPIVT